MEYPLALGAVVIEKQFMLACECETETQAMGHVNYEVQERYCSFGALCMVDFVYSRRYAIRRCDYGEEYAEYSLGVGA